MIEIRRDVPLAPLTTFELGGPARAFVEVSSEAELLDALEAARREGLSIFVLGAGSNLVVGDRGYDGMVVRIALRGLETLEEGARVVVRVAAGEPWDAFVARAVADGLAGVECLSGIPGCAGATPIQNVGAYGQEVSDTIVGVRVVDRATGQARVLDAARCGFAYRDSRFKGELCDAIVTAVDFALVRGGAPALRYEELARAMHGVDASLASVRAEVLALRRGKSMVIDPADDNRRSAGSFFTNPIVSPAVADEVVARALADRLVDAAEKVPRFPSGDRVKLSAGWLIERAGFVKGTRRGPVGISSRHALALVHHGGGTTRALLALAAEIVSGVQARFGVRIRPEPVFLGVGADEAAGLTA